MVLGTDLDLTSLLPRGVAVTDRRLRLHAPARAQLDLPGGERAKRIRTLERVLDWLAEQRVERDEALVAVGGGTIGDLAGTAAALFNRGLPLVQVPTTWIGMADSAIGGKVAVDLAAAKNAVGAFWPPVAVIGDVAHDPQNRSPFKGDIDLAKLDALVARVGAAQIAYVSLAATVNMAGGQPVSMANVKALRHWCDRHGVKLFLDATRSLDPSSSGHIVVRDQLRARIERRLSELLTLELGARAIRDDRPEGVANLQDREYFTANARLTWRFRRDWTLGGGYEYVWRDEENDPRAATANRFHVGITYLPRWN